MLKLPSADLFELPDDTIYLDGNSLGPLPSSVPTRLAAMLTREWGDMLITGWNQAQWMDQPARVGNLLAPIIGAPANSVMMGDTLSLKVYQALAAALKMRPERRVVLSDSGNFPTDLYMADGLLKLVGDNYELRVVDPSEITDSINADVAALLLTQVDYRTGKMYDMQQLTERAHAAGAVTIWDLAHSAGAVPVELAACQTEFAVGCTYKYLNGGPGAPAFIYVRPDLIDTVQPALAGWLGHEAPFAFDLDYRPGTGIERMRVGTPPVMQMTALEESLQMWRNIDMTQLRQRSIELSELFINEVEKRCPSLQLVSPRDPQERGSQVSFRFEQGYAAMQALIDHAVIGDFRAPDIMRFGITPLYIGEREIKRAADKLQYIIDNEIWRDEKYQIRGRVT
jgi:kynureninase